jgi:mono/diheme cytochrome c family protein
MMKKLITYFIPVYLISLLSSCAYEDMKTTGYEFMPDMYRSPSYETYSANPVFSDSMTARQPVAGTVARGDAIFTDYDRMPYPFDNTPAGYEEAGLKFHNPLEKTADNMKEGKRLYDNYCTHCHGSTGMGDGTVANNNGPKPPAYSSETIKNLSEGKMYHSIHWGKNMMGSHASQLTPTQRWKIVMYVQTLQQSGTVQADSAAAQPANKM